VVISTLFQTITPELISGGSLLCFIVVFLFWLNTRTKSTDRNAFSQAREVLLQERELRHTLEYRLKALEMAESMLSRFTNVPLEMVDDEIEHALGEFGESVGADRAYIFRFGNDGLMSNTHEWCAQGISAEKGNLQDLPIDIFPWWNGKIKAGEYIFIPDVAVMPAEASGEQEILQAQDIKSLLVVPMMMRGEAEGFIGFDAVKEHKSWPAEVVPSLRTFGEIFSNAIDDKLDTLELARSREDLSAVIEEAPLAFLLVDANSQVVDGSGQKLIGLPEQPGKSLSELFPKAPELLEAYQKAAHGCSSKAEISVRKMPVRVDLRPLAGAGIESGWVIVEFHGIR